MAKAFVLPSRGENFGRAVVEAMLVGIPVLMTDRVGIWEQVAAADAAYIARPDVESVLQGLFEIWESYPRARDRAVRARKLVEAQFGIAAVGEQLERMYQEALAAA
jgi:glycosyltransferase involved in cell wall biosynthesis